MDTSFIDVYIGSRIKHRREFLEMSLEFLGNHLDMTCLEMLQCEDGGVRINAHQLFQLSETLEVPVEFFFEGMPRVN